MNLIEKWQPILDYNSEETDAVPKEEWDRVAEMLEFTEAATFNTIVREEDIEWAIEQEKKHGGYFYQQHQGYDFMRTSSRAKFEIPRVRKEYKTLTIEDLFIRYI